MPKKNTQTHVTFFVYNAQTGAAVTGQTSAQLSVFLSQDGGAFSQISSPAIQQIDAVNLPGFYRLTLTAGNTNANHILLRFASILSNVIAEPCELYLESYTVLTDIPAAPQMPQVPTVEQIADGILTRSVTNVETTAPLHSLCTVILAQLESEVSGSEWNIRRTNGSTPHASLTVTSSPSTEAITGVHS